MKKLLDPIDSQSMERDTMDVNVDQNMFGYFILCSAEKKKKKGEIIKLGLE